MELEHQGGFGNQMVAGRKKPRLKGALQAWPTLQVAHPAAPPPHSVGPFSPTRI